MASNDQWPPVAPSVKNSSKNRSNSNNKKPTKEHQQQVLTGLTEMFQNTMEAEVILSVAHSCDWELQSCIDALIALSSTVEPQNQIEDRGAFVVVSNDPSAHTDQHTQHLETDIFKMDKIELQKQQEEFKKFEKIKKTSSKNRMGSFRGNISKLDSNYKEKEQRAGSFDSIWNPPVAQSKADEKNWIDHSSSTDAQYVLPQMPQSANPWIEGLRQASTTPMSLNTYKKNPSTSYDKTAQCNQNKSKKESELCGLKVQYRTAGMESSSEDDDADVVIEEELNGNIPTSIPVNVSQLLSSSIQTPPQIASSYTTKTVSTPSPPNTPKRSIHQATLLRITAAIKNGDKIVVLMRGLPGSGKSYLAKSLITTIAGNPSDYIFSTDDYFVALGRGIYMYDPRKLDDAHIITQKKVYEAMNTGKTPIIVDNTNTQGWEMRPYAALAVRYGYLIETLEPDTVWATKVKELVKRNSHGVPKDKIQQMLSRFEPALTGDKLLAMYSLKYEPGNDPREIDKNTAQELSVKVGQSSGSTPIIVDDLGESFKLPEASFIEETPEETNPLEELTADANYKASPEEHFLQVFGAIGSERKNSVVADAPIIPEPINEEGHTANDENIMSHCSEMLEQDEEFGKKRKRNEDSPTEESEEEDDGVRSAVHNFLSELTQGYNNTSGTFVPTPEQRQSSVIITELFEEQEIQNVADIAASLLESTSANDINEIDVNKPETLDKEKLPELTKTPEPESHIEPIATETEKLIEDDKEIENSSAEDKDLSFIDAENLSDIETAEEPTEPTQPQSTLGTIFNIIKSSILGNAQDDDQLSQSSSTEIEQAKELQEFSILDDSKSDPEIEQNQSSESISADDVDILKSPIAELRAAIDSIDPVSIAVKCSDKHDDTEFFSLENQSNESVTMFSVEEVNEFVRALENSDAIDNKVEELVIAVDQPDSVELECKEPEILDNINSITWKESPFPVDDLLLPKVNLGNDTGNADVPKLDACTNTTYYDFNVSYIGGTSEPMYRVIPAFNRHINEGLPRTKPERPPLKLMLDKGSMTGDVFSREVNSELEDTEEKKDRFPELMELFPHIPRDYLVEIFEKVKEDLDWAVELLLEGASDDFMIKIPNEIPELPDESSGIDKEESASTPGSSESSSPDIPVQSSALANNIEDQYEEQQDEEVAWKTPYEAIKSEKLPITPELIKESSTDASDDCASTSTASVSRVESIEDEKSSESDELVELSLGFDCLKGLEQTLGMPNFHIPESFAPVIRIKKSIAEELYASWIESLYQQANARHEQLDQMMAQDAELARSLERKMELEGAGASNESSEPNFEQIMDMELALAKYKNELKSIRSRETPDDLAARLSRQMLHEAIPDIDPDAFNEILKAHNGNFKEAFEVIEMNTGKVIVPCDTRKKQKILMEEVREEDRNLREKEPPIIVVRGVKMSLDDRSEYKIALAQARDSREEAQRQLSLKIQNYNKAAEAYRKGCPGVAAYYSQVARLHTKNIDAAHAAAASAFVEAQSWDDEETLDLHNLFVSEALTSLDEFLEYHLDKLMRSNKRCSKIFIITGRGARSNNGTSKIKPAVSQKLNSRNIKFSEANPGCLKVTLYRKNCTTD